MRGIIHEQLHQPVAVLPRFVPGPTPGSRPEETRRAPPPNTAPRLPSSVGVTPTFVPSPPLGGLEERWDVPLRFSSFYLRTVWQQHPGPLGFSPRFGAAPYFFSRLASGSLSYSAQSAARSSARDSALNRDRIVVPDLRQQVGDREMVLRLDLDQLGSARGRRVFSAATFSQCPG